MACMNRRNPRIKPILIIILIQAVVSTRTAVLDRPLEHWLVAGLIKQKNAMMAKQKRKKKKRTPFDGEIFLASDFCSMVKKKTEKIRGGGEFVLRNKGQTLTSSDDALGFADCESH